MTSKEAHELVIKYATPAFEKLGWSFKKASGFEVIYCNKQPWGFEQIGISQKNYLPIQIVAWGISKRIDEVEKVIQQINKIKPLTPKVSRNSATIHIMDDWNFVREIPESENENDIHKSVMMLENYMKEYVIPLFEELNDIRNIDKMVNGIGDDFWEHDQKKPFKLGHNFLLRRLVIARLSGRMDYDDFIEKILCIAEKKVRENGNILDRTDKSIPLILWVDFLNKVNPLH